MRALEADDLRQHTSAAVLSAPALDPASAAPQATAAACAQFTAPPAAAPLPGPGAHDNDAASFAEVGEHAGYDMDVERGSQSPLRDESELRHSAHPLVAMLCNPPREVLQQAGVTFDDSGKAQWLPCDSDESDAQDLASEAVLGEATEQGVDGCGDGIAGQDAFLQQPYAVQQSGDNTCALGDEQDNDSLVVR